MATTSLVTPLNITGNTTSEQLESLRRFLGEAVAAASRTAIEKLDRQTMQLVLDIQVELLHSPLMEILVLDLKRSRIQLGIRWCRNGWEE